MPRLTADDQEEEHDSLLNHEQTWSRPYVKPWQLLAASLGLLTLILALVTFGTPGPRSARTRGFQRLWNSGASCRAMGCGHDNFMGTCQCNDGCSYFGDCCGDYEQECAPHSQASHASKPHGSCRDLGCGSNSKGCDGIANCNLCDCSEGCGDKGTCCSDFDDYCGGGDSWGDDGDSYDGDAEWDGDGVGDDGDGGDWGGREEHEFGPWGRKDKATTEAPKAKPHPKRTPTPAPKPAEASKEHSEHHAASKSDYDEGDDGDAYGDSEGDGDEKQGDGSKDGGGSERSELPAAEKPTYEASQQPIYELGSDATRHETFQAKRHAWLAMLKWQQVSGCPEQLLEKDIANGEDMQSIPNVASAAVCQRLCTEKGCDVSVWGSAREQPGLSDVCFLKSLNGAEPQWKDNPNTVGAMSCCQAGKAGVCPPAVLETDIRTDESLQPRPGVGSFDECQQLCTQEARCQVFVYGAARDLPGLSDVCFMKSLAEGEVPQLVNKQGVNAGLPCACRAPVEHALWPKTEVDLFTMPTPPLATPAAPGSAYCLVLMRAYTYEASLLKLQYNMRQGVFGCPGWDVFSNQELVIAEGLKTKKVRTSQMCESGGEFKTALNLRIFAAFWREVFTRKDFMNYNWLVKADADSVFVYSRLPGILQPYDDGASSNDGRGVYFNNCKYGMHGPLEVFSQNAVLALQEHFKDCYFYFRKLCSGDCHWGEDLWVDQCLKRRANSTIERVNEYSILEEKHCDPEEGWEDCSNPKKVAFHPFKSQEDWQTCLNNAGG